MLKSCRKQRPSVFRQMAVKTPARRSNTDPVITTKKRKTKSNKEYVQVVPTNFMDLELTGLPQRDEPNRLRRKPSTMSIPEKQAPEIRASTRFFARSATTDFAGARSPHAGVPIRSSSGPKSKRSTTSLPTQNGATYPTFYRRRLDASTRNRVYLRHDDEALSSNSQQLFRRIPGSVLGGLILHSSLVVAVPARLTNSVDIYTLH
ncbi:hypothetical protein CC86DRAFT_281953 [Ophiobolus disseminans]|uniref:Uncharacterized protein n=1 Tax=Ophiobolus disseminans TaxID=1469910 RepID=A0A6A7ADM0_9PLEO|nr:hypothetical protein CC86DRAFT_281953 [Ophiobolus disseminans]